MATARSLASLRMLASAAAMPVRSRSNSRDMGGLNIDCRSSRKSSNRSTRSADGTKPPPPSVPPPPLSDGISPLGSGSASQESKDAVTSDVLSLSNQYYVIQTKESYDTTTSSLVAKFRHLHSNWVRSAESQGVLFAAGEFKESVDAGAPTSFPSESMYIIRSSSLSTATAFAATDPFNMNCVTTYRVVPWSVECGCVGLKVCLANNEYKLE